MSVWWEKQVALFQAEGRMGALWICSHVTVLSFISPLSSKHSELWVPGYAPCCSRAVSWATSGHLEFSSSHFPC